MRAAHSSLPSGRDIARQYGRHERWGRLVKRAGLAGDLEINESSTAGERAALHPVSVEMPTVCFDGQVASVEAAVR